MVSNNFVHKIILVAAILILIYCLFVLLLKIFHPKLLNLFWQVLDEVFICPGLAVALYKNNVSTTQWRLFTLVEYPILEFSEHSGIRASGIAIHELQPVVSGGRQRFFATYLACVCVFSFATCVVGVRLSWIVALICALGHAFSATIKKWLHENSA